MLANGPLTLQGNGLVDSFDSSDPDKSTDGEYDSDKRQTNATVATIDSGNPALIAQSGDVYGDLVTGPGGTIDMGSSFDLHGGTTSDTAEDSIPPVTVPVSTALTDGAISGDDTINVLVSPQDMAVPSISLGGNQTLSIDGVGRLRLYVAGGITFSGNSSVELASEDVSVELYSNGDIFLNSMINSSGNATNFTVYGTENCNSIEFHGNDTFVGTIYAPYAAYRHNGNADFIGAIVASAIDLLGNADFHYDEALAKLGNPVKTGYQISSWVELKP